MGHRKSIYKKEIHSIAGLPQETRKISNKRSNFTLKVAIKRKINKSKVSRKKLNIKAKINKIKSKKTIQKIDETKKINDSFVLLMQITGQIY